MAIRGLFWESQENNQKVFMATVSKTTSKDCLFGNASRYYEASKKVSKKKGQTIHEVDIF